MNDSKAPFTMFQDINISSSISEQIYLKKSQCSNKQTFENMDKFKRSPWKNNFIKKEKYAIKNNKSNSLYHSKQNSSISTPRKEGEKSQQQYKIQNDKHPNINNLTMVISQNSKNPQQSNYNKIYQNYGGGLGTTVLKGSTCNVYQCGEAIKNVSTDASALYQGRTATHSSIAIGSTERIPGTNLLRAKTDTNSTGIMFKNANGDIKNFGSAVIDGVLIQHLKIKTTGL